MSSILVNHNLLHLAPISSLGSEEVYALCEVAEISLLGLGSSELPELLSLEGVEAVAYGLSWFELSNVYGYFPAEGLG